MLLIFSVNLTGRTQVCVFRSQNKLKEAIEELNSIVSVFYSDVQSWLELVDVYSTVSDYKVTVLGGVAALTVPNCVRSPPSSAWRRSPSCRPTARSYTRAWRNYTTR